MESGTHQLDDGSAELPPSPNKPKRIPKKAQYGDIEGFEVGHRWSSRKAMYEDGFHIMLRHGIHGTIAEGACSIVVSGGYEDDIDEGEEILYTGAGGQHPDQDQDRGQKADQHWTPANKSLQTSHIKRRPVRVIRGYHLNSVWAPAEGYRYDGLYDVIQCYETRGKSGHKICMFRLRRQPGQPPLPGPSYARSSSRISTVIERHLNAPPSPVSSSPTVSPRSFVQGSSTTSDHSGTESRRTSQGAEQSELQKPLGIAYVPKTVEPVPEPRSRNWFQSPTRPLEERVFAHVNMGLSDIFSLSSAPTPDSPEIQVVDLNTSDKKGRG